MLRLLQVHNFALIEDASVEFESGFNIFTGETGAGKSILIDAFGILLGGRASVDFIRSGTDGFWVQGVFDYQGDEKIKTFLAAQGIEDDEYLFLKRRLSKNGKSMSSVNGIPVPLTVLRSLAELLVDIHGQHENQALLKAQTPRELVDVTGGKIISDARKSYDEIYTAYIAAKEKLERLQSVIADRELILDRLNWEIDEINGAGLREGEERELRDEAKRLAHAGKIEGSVREAHDVLDSDRGALESLAEARDALLAATRYDERLQPFYDAIDSAWIGADETRRELAEFLASNDFDPARLDKVQRRLEIYYRLHKKYGADYNAVQNYLQQATARRDEIVNLEEHIASAKKELENVLAELTRRSEKLTDLRCRYGEQLSLQVTKHLRDLAMPQGRFEVRVTKLENFTVSGRDELTFYFTANQGETLQPLAKVASGGELSRLALALKTAQSDEVGVPTMVFDEIDSGVGGVTARRMAEKMALIARSRQVLCITHLPQIASFADRHIYIYKESDGKRTTTRIKILKPEQRVAELVRMTVGGASSPVAEQMARDLAAEAQNYKEQARNKKINDNCNDKLH